jgi:type IV pilus biogenesis protein CpaD/CtpE
VNFLEKSIPKVLAVLALALLLAAGCAETPKDPDPNIKPDTFITTYNIDTAPDSATFYYVSVYWRGTDTDGETVAYRYWVDNGDTTETTDPSVRVRMDFPNSTTTYTFYVES